MSQLTSPSESEIVERLRQELAKAEPSRRKRIVDKFVLAALGSIPWVGGFISAAAAYRSEEAQLQGSSRIPVGGFCFRNRPQAACFGLLAVLRSR